MKPFNLEEAKSGKPCCTRDGRDIRIICFDVLGPQPILALHKYKEGDEGVYKFCIDGKYNLFPNEGDSCNDLFMKPVKKTYWVNVYKYDHKTNPTIYTSNLYLTFDEAFHMKIVKEHYLGTFPIEIEE